MATSASHSQNPVAKAAVGLNQSVQISDGNYYLAINRIQGSFTGSTPRNHDKNWSYIVNR